MDLIALNKHGKVYEDGEKHFLLSVLHTKSIESLACGPNTANCEQMTLLSLFFVKKKLGPNSKTRV